MKILISMINCIQFALKIFLFLFIYSIPHHLIMSINFFIGLKANKEKVAYCNLKSTVIVPHCSIASPGVNLYFFTCFSAKLTR